VGVTCAPYIEGADEHHQVIIYVVDAHAYDMIPMARQELHRLLEGAYVGCAQIGHGLAQTGI